MHCRYQRCWELLGPFARSLKGKVSIINPVSKLYSLAYKVQQTFFVPAKKENVNWVNNMKHARGLRIIIVIEKKKSTAILRGSTQLCATVRVFINVQRYPTVPKNSLNLGLGCVQTDATTPNIVAPTMLGVVASVLAVVCKRMQ